MIALKIDDGRTFPVTEQNGSPFVRALVARDPHEPDPTKTEVGHISWNEFTAEIWGIEVRADLRRQGIATMLYLLARQREPRLHHQATRTDDGDAWARSLGDPLPERIAA